MDTHNESTTLAFALRNSDMAETWSIFDLGERVRIFLDKSAQHARYIIFATRATEIIQQAPPTT